MLAPDKKIYSLSIYNKVQVNKWPQSNWDPRAHSKKIGNVMNLYLVCT